MAIIRPVTELQRKVGELSRLAKETKEPIYLTKNGAEHLVLIDSDTFAATSEARGRNASKPEIAKAR